MAASGGDAVQVPALQNREAGMGRREALSCHLPLLTLLPLGRGGGGRLGNRGRIISCSRRGLSFL